MKSLRPAWLLVLAALLLNSAIAAAAESTGHSLGRKVYNFRCYFCHGYAGDAKTLASRFLAPAPRDFRATAPSALPRERMLDAVTRGRPGTAMKGFADVLAAVEIEAVVDFVRDEFMARGAPNTRYHTAENGWPDHERYRAAFPFVTGELAPDAESARSAAQRSGLELYLQACISCHEPARPGSGPVFEQEAVSYPRFGFAPGDWAPDAVSGASPFAVHEVPPAIPDLSPRQREGEKLYQANCAFCHAADGTGKGWIGRFLQPHPRDLTSPSEMEGMTRDRLRRVIREGLPGTSMPAWRGLLSGGEVEALIDYLDRAFGAVRAQHGPDG